MKEVNQSTWQSAITNNLPKSNSKEWRDAENQVKELNELIKRDNYDPVKHFIISCLISTVALLISVISLIVSICNK